MGNILGGKKRQKWLSRTDTSRQIILIARGKYKKKKTQKKTIFIFYFILFYKTPWENRTPGKIRQQFSLAGLFWLCPVCVCVCRHHIPFVCNLLGQRNNPAFLDSGRRPRSQEKERGEIINRYLINGTVDEGKCVCVHTYVSYVLFFGLRSGGQWLIYSPIALTW
jgi:hypothetical protein